MMTEFRSTALANRDWDERREALPDRQGAPLPAYPRDMSVHELFRWYAENRPSAPAILFDSDIVTYRELDARTNRLARRLARLGVGPGSVVGLLTNRSVETIVAWLAALKCGAAYLPLDPAYPESALAYMAEDCKPTVVLGEQELIDAGLKVGDLAIRPLEQEIELAEGESAEPYYVATASMDTAYLMYTSGSTGRPKGVMVPHRGIVRLVRDQNYMHFDANEVFLLISALAFDVSTWEVWGALLNGARIAVVKGARLSIDQIATAVEQHGVTSIYLTSALFHAVVDQNIDALRGVRQVLIGGDVMSPEHSFKVMARLPECQLINAYGPTEATTYCVCYRLPHAGWGGGSVPIGVPLSHTEAHILDEQMRPVADGEVGLLWTAGDGVAKGYLNRPELNAERFVEDPFRKDGSLMYLTGDLARMRPDGNIEFLGRNDRQVKIDGKRIELDEIELNMRRNVHLADAIVVLRKLGTDEKKIAAFLKPVVLPAQPGLKNLVLSELRRELPAHMIPHETTIVEAFPLTANGKVDRTALLALPRPAEESAEPARLDGELEAQVAQIWRQVLSLQHVDRNANFFDLGGTSLQMVRIHAELRQRLASDINIVDLFAYPRISDLARFLDGRSQAADASSAAKMRAARQTAMLRKAQRIVRTRHS
jgi:amino acid adenylation domain-containing protein